MSTRRSSGRSPAPIHQPWIGVAPCFDLVRLAACALALDPSPYLPRVTCPVDLVYGVDDDVVPFEHAHALAAGLVNAPVRVHLTGLYNHTGLSRPPLRAIARESATLVHVLRLLTA